MGLRTMKRRRRENKTDYKLRRGLLESNLPRIVIRITNKYVIAQLVESSQAQDKIIVGASSKDLIKKGLDKKYSGSLKSIPACYLTGFLLAEKIKDKKQKVIIDLGLARTLPGSRVFAVVNGLLDAGLNLNADKKVFPKKERIEANHLKPELKKVFDDIKKKFK